MERKYFNIGDVLGYGWNVMKANFWFFVGVGLVFIIVGNLPNVLRIFVMKMPLPQAPRVTAGILFGVVGWVINIIMGIGVVKIALSFCYEQKPTIGTLFEAQGCFWRYVGAAILYTLILYAGFLLLIFPAFIWGVKFSLWPYYVIEKGLGPVEALKASSRTTMGVKWQLLGFGFVCGAIIGLGFLCLIVGVFAAFPTVMVAKALVYRQLDAQMSEYAQPEMETDEENPYMEDNLE